MSSCRRTNDLTKWAKLGAGAELDRELELHANACASCRGRLTELRSARRILGELPVHELEPDARDAMRFALMAEARHRHAGQSRQALWPARWGIGLRRVALAAAVLTLGLASLGVIRSWPRVGHPRPTAAELPARIELEPGAAGTFEQALPDQVYSLRRGAARFVVRRLAQGERFRVAAGDGHVEVRGTRFRVAVADGRLHRVQVEEGRVLVWVQSELVADLLGGQDWKRSSDPQLPGHMPRSASVDTPLTAEEGLSGGHASRCSTGRHVWSEKPRPPDSAAAAAGTSRAPGASSASPTDAAFARAWRLLNHGQPEQAAAELDVLGQDASLDPARRADVLYWAAQAHARAGGAEAAESRARRLLLEHPEAWRSADAALLVGEAALGRGDTAEARRWLERATTSPDPATRARALSLLERLRTRQ